MIPVAPYNGQIYISPGGTTYKYVAADNKWIIVLCVCLPSDINANAAFDVFRKDITLLRTISGAYTNGVWEAIQQTVSVIKASVQPVTPEEMQMVPENRRHDAKYSLYTSTRLRAANADLGLNADIVYLNDRPFEIIGADYWQNGIINHYRGVTANHQPDLNI